MADQPTPNRPATAKTKAPKDGSFTQASWQVGTVSKATAPPTTPAGPSKEGINFDDELPRNTLKLYGAAADDDAGIDLTAWEVPGGRLQTYLDLVERERTMEKARPVKELPLPAPVRIDKPQQIGTVSPRTRYLSAELKRREQLLAANRRISSDLNKMPVRVKQSIHEAIQAQLPPSPRKSKAVAEQMAAEKRALIQAKVQAREEAKRAREAAIEAGELDPREEKKVAWAEGKHERERRMYALMADGLKAADEGASVLRGQLNAFRELAKEKVAELELLKAELELLEHEHRKNGGEATDLSGKRDELSRQVELADEQALGEEAYTLTYAFMQERMRMKRPHLEGRLAYMRSLQVELAIRHQEASEANRVAVAYQARMDQRMTSARRSFAKQVEAHKEQREGLKDQLYQMGSAKRKAMGSDTTSMSQSQLDKLNAMIDADHAEMAHMIELRNKHAEEKSNIAFAAASNDIDAQGSPTKLAKSFVNGRSEASLGAEPDAALVSAKMDGKRPMGKREAWQRLCILTGAESIRGVLEYWEEKMETKEALQYSEEERVEEIAKQKKMVTTLTVRGGCLMKLPSSPCSSSPRLPLTVSLSATTFHLARHVLPDASPPSPDDFSTSRTLPHQTLPSPRAEPISRRPRSRRRGARRGGRRD